jgi:hypothetical protein
MQDFEEQLQELKKQVQALCDKESIREKLMVYGRICDRCDIELAKEVFAEDSICEYGPYFEGTGYELCQWLIDAHGMFSATTHQMTNMLINLDGDRASSETSHVGVVYNDSNSDNVEASLSFSRYLDKWERRDGDWLIVSRKVLSDIAYVSAAVYAKANYGEYSRDKNDLSYKYYTYRGSSRTQNEEGSSSND